APHGGLFVLAIPQAVEHVMQYLLSIALGTIVCGLMYALLKPSAVAQSVYFISPCRLFWCLPGPAFFISIVF
ncbi:hypothetical protein AIZ15_24720, partial [Salmonella enterica subsp. enterica serovar Typhimurium]